MVEVLLEKVPIVNVPFLVEAALMLAARNGYGDIVKLLLQKGAKKDLKDRRDKTAQMLAKENGHEAVEQLLLKHHIGLFGNHVFPTS